MIKLLAAATFGMVLANPAHSEEIESNTCNIGLTADGTWDCIATFDACLGAIVVADLSYAFIDPNGKVGTYGKLHKDG